MTRQLFVGTVLAQFNLITSQPQGPSLWTASRSRQWLCVLAPAHMKVTLATLSAMCCCAIFFCCMHIMLKHSARWKHIVSIRAHGQIKRTHDHCLHGGLDLFELLGNDARAVETWHLVKEHGDGEPVGHTPRKAKQPKRQHVPAQRSALIVRCQDRFSRSQGCLLTLFSIYGIVMVYSWYIYALCLG